MQGHTGKHQLVKRQEEGEANMDMSLYVVSVGKTS